MRDSKKRFARHLRSLREARKLSQEALADAIGVSYPAVSNIERGINGPRFMLLEKLARKLMVKERDLFDF